MAAPLTPDEILAALRKWKVPFEEWPGWRTRGRPESLGWGPINMFLVHHTGSDSQSDAYIDWLFTEGRASEGIPAPLAQFMARDDGLIIVGAAGRANQAGEGSSSVLAKVAAEDFDGYDSELTPGPDNTDGNARSYGVEVMYSGSHGMSAAQYHSVVLLAAAILDAYGWTALSAIGHREWSRRKWDPGHNPMDKYRRDVRDRLAAGPEGNGMDWKDKIKSFVRPDGDERAELAIAKSRRDSFRLRQPLFYSGRHNARNKYAQAAGVRDIDNPAYPGTEEDPRPTSGKNRKGASFRYAIERIWRWVYWAYRRIVKVDDRTARIETKLDAYIATHEQRVQDAVETALKAHDERVVKVNIDVLAEDTEDDGQQADDEDA